MEGTPSDITSSPDKKGESKSDKKSEKAVGLGKTSFEFAHKKETAEKMADSASIWEKLIPKEAGPAETPESAKAPDLGLEQVSAESAEEASDPSVENLSVGEKAEVVKDYAQGKIAELEAGRSGTEEPAEAAAREESIEFLQTVEQAAATTPLEPLEGSPADGETVSEGDDGEIVADLNTPAEFEDDQAIELNGPVQTAEGAAYSDPVQPATSNTAPTGYQPPASPNAPSAANGSGNQPPTNPNAPPTNPYGPGGPNGPPASGPGGPNSLSGAGASGQAGPGFNAMPAYGINPNTAPAATRVEYVRDTRNEGSFFLAGGILGYMLGRRRGRIKTEKRLKVVSKQLEKQIGEVRQQVVRQEVMIRQQARERYNESHQPVLQPPPSVETSPIRPSVVLPGTETVKRLTRTEVAVNQQHAAERLGVTTAEATSTAERVQRMDHREVLAIAEKVVIDGTSLRTIYEAKQITEPGLRRITREFLRGGDVKAALKAEIQIKEMQYERDPQMRDRLAASYAGVDAAQPQTAREGMADLVAQNSKPQSSQSSPAADKPEASDQPANKRGQQALVSAWAMLIVVLAIVAITLAMR